MADIVGLCGEYEISGKRSVIRIKHDGTREICFIWEVPYCDRIKIEEYIKQVIENPWVTKRSSEKNASE